MIGDHWLSALVCAGRVGGCRREPQGLEHRVWLREGVPDQTTLTALRSGGVDASVLPVGEVQPGDASASLKLTRSRTSLGSKAGR